MPSKTEPVPTATPIEPHPAEAEAVRRYRPSIDPDDDELEMVNADREAFIAGALWATQHSDHGTRTSR